MDLNLLLQKIADGEKFDYVFFWGHKSTPGKITNSCFSQWYPATFSENGVEYNCTEQYMMAQKAILFKDDVTLKEIMSKTDPAEIKKLGRLVKNFDKKIWDENCRKIVEQGNYLKFSQNEELKKYLLATGNKILVEASPYDDIWGIKMRKEEPDAKNPLKWKGTNYLGFALTNVREKIKNE